MLNKCSHNGCRTTTPCRYGPGWAQFIDLRIGDRIAEGSTVIGYGDRSTVLIMRPDDGGDDWTYSARSVFMPVELHAEGS